ncbi:MAG TPA: hypothetical protein VJ739_13545 [Gemmataceae bacterium]|nr:hypothetical protein [Gemmataceae bacterium]
MGFTVTHRGDTKDIDFEAYTRLLRWRGMDLARARRVPEPGSGRRWLPIWESQAEAGAFADELKQESRDPAWEVVEVEGPISEGPLGPVEIRTARRRDGWVFDLDPLTQRMIQELFPGSCRTGAIFISTETGQDPGKPEVDVADLAEPVAILLTGLSIDKIVRSFGGYRVYDTRGRKELLASMPAQV